MGFKMEDAVLQVWLAFQKRDKEEQNYHLDRIAGVLQGVLASAGFLWSEELQPFLLTCCLNYSRCYGVPFVVYFMRQFCKRYRVSQDQKQTLFASAEV